MNKEQQELIDEVYEKYSIIAGMSTQVITLTKEEFINKIKTDPEFSKTWELKIEERELSLKERRDIAKIKLNREEWIDVMFLAHFKETYDKYTIPTKLITITYNNKTIESYE